MENTQSKTITVETVVNNPIEKIWAHWNEPAHITKWYFASDDWHAPKAENDLRIGGKFTIRMEAKDGSFGFDFNGTYDDIITYKLISYKIEGGRKVQVEFFSHGNTTKVIETFEPENENPVEMQKAGWQAILNNFKKYAEAKN